MRKSVYYIEWRLKHWPKRMGWRRVWDYCKSQKSAIRYAKELCPNAEDEYRIVRVTEEIL